MRGEPYTFGALLGIVTLLDCLTIDQIQSGRYDHQYPQLASRAHCFGPYCLVLGNPRSFEAPIPWRGAQGFFKVSDQHLPDWIPDYVRSTTPSTPSLL